MTVHAPSSAKRIPFKVFELNSNCCAATNLLAVSKSRPNSVDQSASRPAPHAPLVSALVQTVLRALLLHVDEPGSLQKKNCQFH